MDLAFQDFALAESLPPFSGPVFPNIFVLLSSEACELASILSHQ